MQPESKKLLEIFNQQFKELTAIYHRAASQHDISDNEFWVWYALFALDGEQSQQSICEMWSLPKQTVNSVVSGMIKKGLVYLETIPGTRNKKVIRLTEAGQKFGEKVILNVYEAEQRAIGQISPQQLQLCTELLAKYISLLDEEI
ncbi:MarR family winged helix-turn-helix transcriptional regulator [Murimonas intestini]|uniref:MarR family winged helix-turn-helix transcriptional regulator n=1 Tax=Murimonas intestini TaxID=1337051 RepID=UPI0011DD8C13|nr:MarR family transcriptional regulator [Murimonas intestini]